ncbi:hypothetical protein ABK040_003933 [Willaertia magna]
MEKDEVLFLRSKVLMLEEFYEEELREMQKKVDELKLINKDLSKTLALNRKRLIDKSEYVDNYCLKRFEAELSKSKSALQKVYAIQNEGCLERLRYKNHILKTRLDKACSENFLLTRLKSLKNENKELKKQIEEHNGIVDPFFKLSPIVRIDNRSEQLGETMNELIRVLSQDEIPSSPAITVAANTQRKKESIAFVLETSTDSESEEENIPDTSLIRTEKQTFNKKKQRKKRVLRSSAATNANQKRRIHLVQSLMHRKLHTKNVQN